MLYNPPMTKDEVMNQLKQVIDPELGVNIVDLGLVYTVDLVEKEGKPFVKILMTLTTPGCPLAGTIQQMVKDALFVFKELNVDRDVDISITFDPPWTMDMMSQEVRMELGFE